LDLAVLEPGLVVAAALTAEEAALAAIGPKRAAPTIPPSSIAPPIAPPTIAVRIRLIVSPFKTGSSFLSAEVQTLAALSRKELQFS
jgi:hypothetical protein